MKCEMLVVLCAALLAGCSSSKKVASAPGRMAASYWEGKQFTILKSHWGEPTETQETDNGVSVIFRAGPDCTAYFDVDANGIILSHRFEGNSCRFDAYNRLRDIEHP